jgi:hypothetical protein
LVKEHIIIERDPKFDKFCSLGYNHSVLFVYCIMMSAEILQKSPLEEEKNSALDAFSKETDVLKKEVSTPESQPDLPPSSEGIEEQKSLERETLRSLSIKKRLITTCNTIYEKTKLEKYKTPTLT